MEVRALKPKACKVCRAKFVPMRPFESWCCPEHGYEIAAAKLEKAKAAKATAERKQTRAKLEKFKTRGQWQAEVQAAVNAYVRLRDADLPCVSCGRHHGGQYHAGHFRSVGSAPHLRFDVERNLHKQCQPCNTHLHGNLVLYRQELVRRIGLAAVEALEADQAPRHYSIEDLQAIKKTYAAKTRELQKGAP